MSSKDITKESDQLQGTEEDIHAIEGKDERAVMIPQLVPIQCKLMTVGTCLTHAVFQNQMQSMSGARQVHSIGY